MKRHLVPCPRCGREVLDHVLLCPFCGGALEPMGARGEDPEQIRRRKRVLSIIGFLIAAALLTWRLLR
ncbi:MAG: hypothetical protein AB9880_04580 [Christensenellales bacterium]